MRFLEVVRPAVVMRCVYCDAGGVFAHRYSYEYEEREFRLHACPDCGSLHYDPPETLLKVVFPYTEAYRENTRVGARFFFEAGYYADWTVVCALAALAGVGREERGEVRFVDIGAGFGLSSYFVREVLGIEPIVVEPAYSGEIGAALLGLRIERAYFEDLPAEVLAGMAGRRCRLHLNSVIEHLADPAEPLRQAMRLVDVDAVAAIVPNGDFVDPAAPFLTMLPTLAPGDHLHLPTREGMMRFMRRLGFSDVEVMVRTGLLVAVGSRRPLLMPGPAAISAGADALLRRLSRHEDRMIAVSAMARRLLMSVQDPLQAPSQALRRELREHLEAAIDRPAVLARLRSGEPWPEMPFDIAVTSYALGRDAMERGAMADALAWFDVVEAAAEEMAASHPLYAGLSIDYRWTARLVRAQALVTDGRFGAAEAVLDGVIGSTGPLAAGSYQVVAAREMKSRLRGSARLLAWLRYRVWWRALRSWSAAYWAVAHAWFYLRWGGYWLRFVAVHGGAVVWPWLVYGWRVVRRVVTTEIVLLPSRLLVAARGVLARRRGSWLVRGLVGLARRVLRAADNAANVDVHSNGDAFLLRAVVTLFPGDVVDFGARDGPFAVLAAGMEGVSGVHAFEADAAEREVFALRVLVRKARKVRLDAELPSDGDAMLAARGVARVAVLRLAASGREREAMAAFGATLREGRVGAVRFSHGRAHVAQHVLLADLVADFAALGMPVFHLRPNGIGAVTAEMEDFGARSYVALLPELAARMGRDG